MIRSISLVLSLTTASCLVLACSETNDSDDGAGGSTGGTDASSGGANGSSGGSANGSGGGDGSGGNGAGNQDTLACKSGFTRAWRDEFETFDTSRWGKASHSFDENEAQFTAEQVFVEDGKLVLQLEKASSGAKPYVSGEARTLDSYTYGCIVTRAKFAKGSGLVSSLFTFYDEPDFATKWNEIDIEFLGRYDDRVQYNPIVTIGGTKSTAEHLDTVSFDPSADFHEYAIEWTPGKIVWLIDGEVRHTETGPLAQGMTQAQKIMMNLWPANIPGWVGPIDEASADGARSEYDFVEYWTLDP